MQPTRRSFLTGGLALALAAAGEHQAQAASKPGITVQKSPT